MYVPPKLSVITVFAAVGHLHLRVHPDLRRDVDVTADQAASLAHSASDITGTSPARDTRFGSSKDAEIFSGSCDNRI